MTRKATRALVAQQACNYTTNERRNAIGSIRHVQATRRKLDRSNFTASHARPLRRRIGLTELFKAARVWSNVFEIFICYSPIRYSIIQIIVIKKKA